ncbi:uncharacterized [Tachysurus ichikawai]
MFGYCFERVSSEAYSAIIQGHRSHSQKKTNREPAASTQSSPGLSLRIPAAGLGERCRVNLALARRY